MQNGDKSKRKHCSYVCEYRVTVCPECEALVIFKEKKTHSCIKFLKGELRKMGEILKLFEIL